MYERACTIVTALFFALFMTLSVHDVFRAPLTSFGLCWNACFLLLYGGCLALLALRRPVFPTRVCLGVCWVLTFFLTPHPFALDDPGPDRDFFALYLPRLFAGSFAVAAAYSLLCVLAENRRGAGASAAEETPKPFLIRLLTGKGVAGLVAFVVGMDLFVKLGDWIQLAASTHP